MWLDRTAASLHTSRHVIPGDGNCLFRALASQCTGSICAASLRRDVISHLRTNEESRYLYEAGPAAATTSFSIYLDHMSRDGTYGDHLCLQAAATILKAEVWVLNASTGSRGTLRREGCPAQRNRVLGLTYRPEHYDILRIPMALLRSLRACQNGILPLEAPSPANRNRRQPRAPPTPAPRPLTITTINVTSLQTHHRDVADLPADILALQETRVGKEHMGTHGQYFHAKGREVHWGKALAKTGGGERQQIAPGGVAIMTKSGLIAQTIAPKSPVEKRCHDSTRVVHTAVAVGAGAAFHVISLYAHAGQEAAAEREALIKDALEMATGLGHAVPVIIIGDFNCNASNSVTLAAAQRSGRWVDVAESLAAAQRTPPPFTCRTANSNGTRIDMCLANATAAPAIYKVTVDSSFDDCPFPTHVPLTFTLDLNVYSGRTRRCVLPKPFPLDRPRNTPETAVAFASQLEKNDRSEASGESKLAEFAEVGEKFLLLLHEDSIASPHSDYCGRSETSLVKTARHATKHSSKNGASSKLTRARDAVMGNLRTLLQIGRARLLVDKPYAMTRRERYAWEALSRLRGGPLRDEITEALFVPNPGVDYLHRLLEKLEGSQREAFAAMKAQRSLHWKHTMQNVGSKGQGAIFDYVADRFTTPAAFMKQQDGTLTADPAKVDSLLRDNQAWGGIFQKYASSPEPSWDSFLAVYEDVLPAAEDMTCEPIKVEDVHKALKRMKRTTSPGMHGWRAHEVEQLPDSIIAILVECLNAVERDGVWPEALMQALVPLIPKPDSDGDPLSQRPITITAVLYRIWASIRAQSAFPWLDKLSPAGLHGCRPKHGTEDLYWHLAAQLECAHLTGEHIFGVAIDFKKCFDTVPINIAMCLAARLGFNGVVLSVLREAYVKMKRHFRCNGSVGEPFTPTNGIMQGCPLSVILINIVISVWMREVDSKGAETTSFVDDIYATAPSHQLQQMAVDRTVIFSHHTQMDISVSKSLTFSTCRTRPCEIKVINVQTGELMCHNPPTFLPVKNSFDSTGVMQHAQPGTNLSSLPVSNRISNRSSNAVKNLGRVRSLPTPVNHRDHIAAMTAGSKCYYGASVTYLSPEKRAKLQKNFTAAVWTGPSRRAVVAVMHILQHGHRLDPEMVFHIRRLRAWIKQMRRENCRHLCAVAWQHRDSLSYGPFFLLNESLNALGWDWVAPNQVRFTNESGDQTLLDVDTLTEKQATSVEAEARHKLRNALMRSLANKRSSDYDGLQHGVDGRVTRHLLEDPESNLTGYQKGILRSIIAGAMTTTGRSGLITDGCPYCETEARETVRHMWWECSAWEEVRSRHPVAAADRTDWPNCLVICGVAPRYRHDCHDNVLPRDDHERIALVRNLQRLFIEIVRQRQIRDDRPAESARHHRLVDYPWGWSSPQPMRVQLPSLRYQDVGAIWKHSEDLWYATNHWVNSLQWAHNGSEHSVSYIELAIDFELTTGLSLPGIKNRRYQPYCASQTVCTVRNTLEGRQGTEVFFDGGARQNGTVFARAGAGAVVYIDGVKAASVATPLPFARSNNVAEYEGASSGLCLLRDLPPEVCGQATIYGDSKLIIEHIKGNTTCKENLQPFLHRIRAQIRDLQPRYVIEWRHVKRNLNTDADALSNEAMDTVEVARAEQLSQAAAEYPLFQKSVWAKALSLQSLTRDLRSVVQVDSWTRGKEGGVTSLTALGGTVVQGVNRRAVLSAKTEAVLRHLNAHNIRSEQPHGPSSILYEESQAWAARFYPQDHYAANWTEASSQARGRAAVDTAAFRSRPPRPAPAGARKNAKIISCESHGKVRCVSCVKVRAVVETCCNLHHREDDGLELVMDFCLSHRLTRCGACHLDRKSLNECCHSCHPQFKHAAQEGIQPLHHRHDPSGASAVT